MADIMADSRDILIIYYGLLLKESTLDSIGHDLRNLLVMERYVISLC